MPVNLWIAGLCLASLVAVAAVGLLWAVESSHRRRARHRRSWAEIEEENERRAEELRKRRPGDTINGHYVITEDEGSQP